MGSEALFSLEVYIKGITSLSVACGIPAVTFRFLDYPTVIIYCIDLNDVEKLKEKVDDLNKITLQQHEQFHHLRNSLEGYDFHKGKSCLFRQTQSRLKDLLSKLPLYMTLIDCLHDKPKLLGLCTIPLLSLMQKVEKERTDGLEDSPAVASEDFTVSICNLMSTKIGTLTLNTKLTCFGCSLLRHVTVQERENDSQINILLQNLSIHNGKNNTTRKDNRNSHSLPQSESVEKLFLPADGNKDGRPSNVVKTSKSSQFSDKPNRRNNEYHERRHREKKAKLYGIDHENTDKDLSPENTVRPPPLFLNLHEKENFQKVSKYFEQETIYTKTTSRFLLESKFNDVLSDHGSNDDDSYCEVPEEEKPIVEVLCSRKKRPELYNVIGVSEEENKRINKDFRDTLNDKSFKGDLQNERFQLNSKNDSKPHISARQQLRAHAPNMPVLCSLVKEIALLNNLLNGEDEQVEKNGLRLEKQQQQLNSNRKEVTKNVLSRLRKDKCNKENSSGSAVNQSKNKQNTQKYRSTEKKSKHRKKHTRVIFDTSNRQRGNTYGLTKTQRLRYAMTHDGNEPIEFIQQQQKRQKLVNQQQQQSGWREKREKQPRERRPHQQSLRSLSNTSIPDLKDGLNENRLSHLKPDTFVRISVPFGEEECGKETMTCFNESINEQKPDGSESKVDLHSPVEPREISLSELGYFNSDMQPWSSTDVQQERISSSFCSQKRLSNKEINQHPYSDDSFLSDDSNEGERSRHSTITGTSSVSIPLNSQLSNSSPLPSRSRGNLTPSRHQSSFVMSKNESNSVLSGRQSNLSLTSNQFKNDIKSLKSARNPSFEQSKRKSPSSLCNTSVVLRNSNRNLTPRRSNSDIDFRNSSIPPKNSDYESNSVRSSKESTISKSSSSSNSSSKNTSKNSSLIFSGMATHSSASNKNTEAPKLSVYSPTKSNYKKVVKEEKQQNYLNITLPSAEGTNSQVASSNNS